MTDGAFNVNGLSSADAAFLDEIVIVPDASSLKGTAMTLTATAIVSGTAEATGGRAQGSWWRRTNQGMQCQPQSVPAADLTISENESLQ